MFTRRVQVSLLLATSLLDCTQTLLHICAEVRVTASAADKLYIDPVLKLKLFHCEHN